MKIIDKLSTYAALIGVISAIGGGFYAWGEFNTRLSAIEKKPSVNLTPLKDGLKEINSNLSETKINLIDRINKVEEKIKPVDLTNVYAEIAKVREELAALNIPKEVNLSPIIEALQKLEKALAIVQKENQVQDAMIEEIKLKANNPLAS
tara:strand:- start:143 stop:589 length:447 start_codon:yes stop_codon:yes gene_type:complete